MPTIRQRVLVSLLCLFSLVAAPPLADAGVSRVQIERRDVVAGGAPFGDVGAYEKLAGVIHFAWDPEHDANRRIVDLDLAPRNERGLVEATANFMVLQPVDPERRRGVGLLEVSNRGGKASLGYFNRARFSRDPMEIEEFGDGLLMRQGLTIIWVGWQWDVPEGEGQLRLHAPVARHTDGSPIRGLVRADWTVDERVHTLPLAHRNHIAYPVVDPEDPGHTLTVRSGRDAPRHVVPRERWRFARRDESGSIVPDRAHIFAESGFAPGIYELVYTSEDPRVVGLGLAAVRDAIRYAKHDDDCPFPVERGVAFGVSQTGRFLRHFLYQGFNVDEAGQTAFDGLLIHTAGAGRGSFNHRFAQPSRDAHRYSAFQYPTDIFPFTSRSQTDHVTGLTDGLLERTPRDHRPKTFYTNTGYEYWGRAASLIHTSVDGLRDIDPLPNERIYHLRSGQHFVERAPLDRRRRIEGSDASIGNDLDFLLTLRALLVALVDWVESDVEPPPSAYPRLDEGTLVSISELDFPMIPGVEAPQVIHHAYRADYGARFRSEGIIDRQPPCLGPVFPSMVSQVDRFGNEIAGVPTIETLVPLATFTPWATRVGYGVAEEELIDFRGLFIPFPRVAAPGDTRPNVSRLYESEDAFRQRVSSALDELVARRVLLPEDRARAQERMHRLWALITGGGGR